MSELEVAILEILSLADLLQLPKPVVGFEEAEETHTITWREDDFDLFIYIDESAEVYGYFRHLEPRYEPRDSLGEQLDGLGAVRVCMGRIPDLINKLEERE